MAYKVKKGDTLGAIAKQYGVDWKEIAKVNKLDNPNLIRPGQELIIPGQPTSVPKVSTASSHTIKSGETLSGIGKQYGVDWQTIAKLNNIDNPRTIRAGQKLILPNTDFGQLPTSVDTTKREEVKSLQQQLKAEGADIVVDGIFGKQTQQALDSIYQSKNLNPPKLITDKDKLAGKSFHRQSTVIRGEDAIHAAHKGKDDYYSVVDKKTNTFRVFRNGEEIKRFRVGLGSKSGKDFITGITGEKGYTGAGIYNLSNKTLWNTPGQEKYFKRLYGENILALENESGIVQGLAIHQIPKGNTSRRSKLQDSNVNNDDFSWGCINCTKEDYEAYVQYASPGNKVYVMPEEEGNYFEFRNNKVNLTTSNADKDINKYNYTYTGTGNYLSPKTRENTFQPTTYNLPGANDITQKFATTLGDKKAELMKTLGVDSDTYDQMAKSAIGLLGAESDFGKRKLKRNPKHSVYLEELFMDVAEKFGKDQSKRSSGLTQIRYENIPENIKKTYGITRDDLMTPEKSAIATMGMLGQYHQNIISNRAKLPNLGLDNIAEYYPYAHNQPSSLELGTRDGKPLDPSTNTYVSKVNELANQVQMKKLNKKYGGKMKLHREEGGTLPTKTMTSDMWKKEPPKSKNKKYFEQLAAYIGPNLENWGKLTPEQKKWYRQNYKTYSAEVQELPEAKVHPKHTYVKGLMEMENDSIKKYINSPDYRDYLEGYGINADRKIRAIKKQIDSPLKLKGINSSETKSFINPRGYKGGYNPLTNTVLIDQSYLDPDNVKKDIWKDITLPTLQEELFHRSGADRAVPITKQLSEYRDNKELLKAVTGTEKLSIGDELEYQSRPFEHHAKKYVTRRMLADYGIPLDSNPTQDDVYNTIGNNQLYLDDMPSNVSNYLQLYTYEPYKDFYVKSNETMKKSKKKKTSYKDGGAMTPDMWASLSAMIPGVIGAARGKYQAPGAGNDMSGVTGALGAAGSIASLLPGAGPAIGAGLNVLSGLSEEINIPSAYVPMGENQGKYSRKNGGPINDEGVPAVEQPGTDRVHGTPNYDLITEDPPTPLSPTMLQHRENMKQTIQKYLQRTKKGKRSSDTVRFPSVAHKQLRSYMDIYEQKFPEDKIYTNVKRDLLPIEAQNYSPDDWFIGFKSDAPSGVIPKGGYRSKIERADLQKRRYALGGTLNPLSSTTVEVDADNPSRTDSVELPQAFVDDGETISQLAYGGGMDDKFVFSNKLTYPGTNKTFAELDKKIAKSNKAVEDKPYDSIAKNTKKINNELQQNIAGVNEGIANLLTMTDKRDKIAAKNGTRLHAIVNKPNPQSNKPNPQSNMGFWEALKAVAPNIPMSTTGVTVKRFLTDGMELAAAMAPVGKLANLGKVAKAKKRAKWENYLKGTQRTWDKSPEVKSVNDYSKMFKALGGSLNPGDGSDDQVRTAPKDYMQWNYPQYGYNDPLYGVPAAVRDPLQYLIDTRGTSNMIEVDAISGADPGMMNDRSGPDWIWDYTKLPRTQPTQFVQDPGVTQLANANQATQAGAKKVNPSAVQSKVKLPKETFSEFNDMEMLRRAADAPLTTGTMPKLGNPYTSVTSTTAEDRGLGTNIPGVRGSYDRSTADTPGWWESKSEGERLQMMEFMTKAGLLARGRDEQTLYQNRAPISRNEFDPQNALMQQQYAANAARQGLQASGTGASLQANLQNLAANQMRAAGQTQTQYDQMNQQARTQYEQRLAQRQNENIGYLYATDQIRQQDNSSDWNQFRDVLTGIGNLGREKVAVDENKRAAELLVQAYPQIAPYLGQWGLELESTKEAEAKVKEKKKKKKSKKKSLGDANAFQNFLSGKLGKNN